MTRLQLSLNAKGLKNLSRLLAISDPFAVVTVRGDHQDNTPEIVGRTEVAFNNLNPKWATIIFIENYQFGVPCYMEVGVFDFDAKTAGEAEDKLALNDAVNNLNVVCDASSRDLLRNGRYPHRVMGTALFEVGEILASRGNVGSKQLQSGGNIFAHIERSRESGKKGQFKFKLRGYKLRNLQKLGSTSSPFFALSRKVDRPSGATWVKVYQSNVVRSDLHPIWQEALLDIETICNGDLDRAMKISVWDHRRRGNHKFIGEFETSVNSLVKSQQMDGDIVSFDLRKQEKHTGHCEALRASLIGVVDADADVVTDENGIGKPSRPLATPQEQRHEFIDYLTGGCQISLAVAIDFTSSNGDPRRPGTPHYFHPPESSEWNDYEKAIFAVGSILAKYDTDQLFPVWGFGAKYNNAVQHCFQCGPEEQVEGVQGIMDAYRGVFRTPLTMSSPTRFTEVIKTAASYARHEQDVASGKGQLSYTILLILTAGNVEDIEVTKQQLIAASNDPLSVVIVGIGETNFEGMDFLDNFHHVNGESRDITKFVQFNDYQSYNALTQAVLDEIPQQLVDHFYSRGILPGQNDGYVMQDDEIQPPDEDERRLTFLG